MNLDQTINPKIKFFNSSTNLCVKYYCIDVTDMNISFRLNTDRKILLKLQTIIFDSKIIVTQ